jgi:hypothetical protein
MFIDTGWAISLTSLANQAECHQCTDRPLTVSVTINLGWYNLPVGPTHSFGQSTIVAEL